VGAAGARDLTLDAGALIAVERGQPRMIALLAEALRTNVRLFVPAGVVAQVWRGGARQSRLSRLLALDAVEVVALDTVAARAIGVLLGRARTGDVVDASVVWCARRTASTIVTSDADDIRRIDPNARLATL
jgi:predicted nucleic acid-binding protein